MQQQELGRGSFGSVFVKNTHTTISAIKKIPLQQSPQHALVLNEDSILSLCNHPHIVKYHSSHYSQNEQIYCIQMQHLPGGSLQQVSLNDNYKVLEEWTLQIASALVYLHERGIIHRDIKLSNLMLNAEKIVKLIDFGVSIWKWMLPYESNSCVGSPCYMAPQIVLKQKYNEKIDIYALGICLYQLIHGHPPFKGEKKVQYWQNMLSQKVKYKKECPTIWRELIKKMIQRNPNDRLSSQQLFTTLKSRQLTLPQKTMIFQ